MTVDWRYIGDQLHDRRENLDLSKSDAARRAGVSKDAWDDVEDGDFSHMSDETLVSIARTLDLPPAGFLSKCGRDPKAAKSVSTGKAAKSGSTGGGARPGGGRRQTKLVAGVYIHDRRASLGMTKGQAARRAGLSDSTWKEIENDEISLDDDLITKIAETLSLDAEELKKMYGRKPQGASAE